MQIYPKNQFNVNRCRNFRPPLINPASPALPLKKRRLQQSVFRQANATLPCIPPPPLPSHPLCSATAAAATSHLIQNET